MTDTPRLADTSPQHWKYISEGGSSIVFSYSGPPHPVFDGTALRLRKAPVLELREHEAPEQYQQPQLAEGEEDEPDDPTIIFQHAVIERLVPKKFLPRLDAVRVDRAWLQELSDLAEEHRPSQRRAKDRIDRGRRKAVLATDLVGGSGWAVEIKVRLVPMFVQSFHDLIYFPNFRSLGDTSRSGDSFLRRCTSLKRRARSRRGHAGSACTRTSRARRARASRPATVR